MKVNRRFLRNWSSTENETPKTKRMNERIKYHVGFVLPQPWPWANPPERIRLPETAFRFHFRPGRSSTEQRCTIFRSCRCSKASGGVSPPRCSPSAGASRTSLGVVLCGSRTVPAIGRVHLVVSPPFLGVRKSGSAHPASENPPKWPENFVAVPEGGPALRPFVRRFWKQTIPNGWSPFQGPHRGDARGIEGT